jgi:hypothetical protein
MTCGATVLLDGDDALERAPSARSALARRSASGSCGFERNLRVGLHVDPVGALLNWKVVDVGRPRYVCSALVISPSDSPAASARCAIDVTTSCGSFAVNA